MEKRECDVSLFRGSVKLEMKVDGGECNPVKGRSELEAEMIIWYFAETLLSWVILLTG